MIRISPDFYTVLNFSDFLPIFHFFDFLAIFWNEITTILSHTTSEGGGHVFPFGGP